jgi:hypothetical protein
MTRSEQKLAISGYDAAFEGVTHRGILLELLDLMPGPVRAEGEQSSQQASVLPTLDKSLSKVLRGAEEGASLATKIFRGVSALADVWRFGPLLRGQIVENFLARTAYNAKNGWSHVGAMFDGKFPVFDFLKDRTWVSLKSADTTSATWFERVQANLDDIGTRGRAIANANTKNPALVLDLRLDPGALSHQGVVDGLKELRQYGQQYGIEIRATEFK